MDLYEELGVKPDATDAEIKAAGRKRQKTTHPDAGGDAEAFGRVQTALKVLLDPDRRAHYDRTGEAQTADPKQAEQQESVSILVQLMGELMAQADPAYLNLPKELVIRLKAMIAADKTNLAAKVAQSRRNVEKIEKTLKRLKFKGDGNDMIGDVLRAQLVTIQREAAQGKALAQRRERVLSAALEMAKGYDYTVDGPPPTAMGVGPMGSGPSLHELAEMLRRAGGGVGGGGFNSF